jgi:hypothetical protein
MSERLDAIVADAVAALHGVLEKHRVTEAEWHAALRFLTDIGRADEFVLLSDVTKTSVLVDALSHDDENGATATDVEGPLYVDDPPWREKPVRVYEDYEGMGDADVLFVRGSVRSVDDTPLPDAVIDIWQTGPSGATTSGTSASRSSTSAGAGRWSPRTARTSSRPCCRSRTPCRPRGPWGGIWRRSASTRGGRRTSTSRSTRPATSRW